MVHPMVKMGTSDSSQKQEIDTRLSDIKDAIIHGQTVLPHGGEQHIKWMYYCLINDIQTSLDPSNDVQIDEDDHSRSKKLWDKYKNSRPSLNEWIATYCGKDRDGDFVPFKGETSLSFGWFKKNDHEKANAIFQYHKRVIESYTEAQKINIKVVHAFLENPQWPNDKNAVALKDQLSDLETVIGDLPKPSSVSSQQAKKEAKKVTPDNYETVHNYAGGIGIDMRQAVAVVARFATVSCPTPQATLDVVEDILERKKDIDLNGLDMMVQDQKVGFVGRMFNHMRPAPYEDTPLFEIAEMAQALPDSARADSARHADHVKVLQKGLEIIHGYDESLRAYVEALEERKAEIDKDKDENSNEAEGLTTRAMTEGILSDIVDDKLNALKTSRAFARAHAVNFATLLRPVMKAQVEKESIAGLAANILLPMQQVQRAFMAYQSNRFGKVIKSVNGAVEATSDGVKSMNKIEAEDVIAQSMQTLTHMIEAMKNDIGNSRNEIIDIARQTEKVVAKGEAAKVTSPHLQ